LSKIIKAGGCSYLPIGELGSSSSQAEEQDHGSEPVFNGLNQLLLESGDVCTMDGKDKSVQCVSKTEEAAIEAARLLDEARQEAELIRERARKELAEAKKRAEELEGEAYSQGFEQGKKDGLEIGRLQSEAAAKRFEKVIQGISQQAETLFVKNEAMFVKLSMEVARQLVLREIKTDPSVVLESMKAALDQAVLGNNLTVYLNPKDFELAKGYTSTELEPSAGLSLELKADPKIERGGCLIESEFGLVDATLQAKWEAVSSAVAEVLSGRTGYKLRSEGQTGFEKEVNPVPANELSHEKDGA